MPFGTAYTPPPLPTPRLAPAFHPTVVQSHSVTAPPAPEVSHSFEELRNIVVSQLNSARGAVMPDVKSFLHGEYLPSKASCQNDATFSPTPKIKQGISIGNMFKAIGNSLHSLAFNVGKKNHSQNTIALVGSLPVPQSSVEMESPTSPLSSYGGQGVTYEDVQFHWTKGQNNETGDINRQNMVDQGFDYDGASEYWSDGENDDREFEQSSSLETWQTIAKDSYGARVVDVHPKLDNDTRQHFFGGSQKTADAASSQLKGILKKERAEGFYI